MKRFFVLCLILTLWAAPFSSWAAPAWPSNISISADGGLLMDADTGTILYGKNIDHAYYPASITKILTALITIEYCDLDEVVVFSHDAVYNVEQGSSNAGLEEGDSLTVRDCLYALLLASANESANALAEHISGTREAFADLMNTRAAALGCTGSHFANPSGLNDPNHYTTAHDMALITQEAIKNTAFLEICGSRSYRLPNTAHFPVEEYPKGHLITNHHKMWNQNDASYYNGAFCGKTGYTSLAGNTLVTCAKRGEMTLIAVILNGHASHYTDTKALFNFGFRNFQSLSVTDFETSYTAISNDMTIAGMTSQDNISIRLDESCRVILPKQASFSDIESAINFEPSQNAPSGTIAEIDYTYNQLPVGKAYLRTVQSIEAPPEEISWSDPAPTEAVQKEESVQEETQETTQALPKRINDGSATEIQIPTGLWAVGGISFSLLLIGLLVAAVRFRIHGTREQRLLLHSKKGMDQLKNKDYSAAEFDRILDQYSPSTESVYTHSQGKSNKKRRPAGRRRR